MNLLGQYADNRAILLRIAFVLGNLTTNSMDYREQVRAGRGGRKLLGKKGLAGVPS